MQISQAILDATNTNPIVIRAGAVPPRRTPVTIAGVAGNTAANGTWPPTIIDAQHFSIPTAGSGAYTGGGTAVWTIVDVQQELSPIIGLPPTILDRLWGAFRVLVRAEDPNRDYRGIWEYVVQRVDQANGTVDLIPDDLSGPMPHLTGISIRTGLPGTSCAPTIGSKLAVGFLNGSPSKPVVVGVFDSSSVDFLSPLISIGGKGADSRPAARVGDAVGPYLISSGSTKVNIS